MGLRLPRLRYLRYSLKDLATSKRRRLLAWLSSVSTTLDATGTSEVFTIDAATEILTVAAHGFTTGDGPFEVSTDTTLPAGLVAATLYWVNVIDTGTFTLHLTRQEALEGVNIVAVSDTGTGIHSITPSTTDAAILDKLRQGYTADTLNVETDIDNVT